MAKYIFRRFLQAVPVLIGITLLVFLIVHAIPGSPWNRQGAARAEVVLNVDDEEG